MADLHLIKEVELGGQCLYCSKPLKGEWFSEFSSETHYKCTLCSCGRENCVEVDFMGTGHDSWSGLEEKVARSSSVKVIERNMRILR